MFYIYTILVNLLDIANSSVSYYIFLFFFFFKNKFS